MSREALGRITVPSGVLVIGDMGYLGDWSGDGPPAPPRDLPPDLVEVASGAKDWCIVGPDAAAAAAELDRQPLTYLYDIPDEQRLREAFAEALDGTGLKAELAKESRRVPHRERAQRAAESGGSGFGVTASRSPPSVSRSQARWTCSAGEASPTPACGAQWRSRSPTKPWWPRVGWAMSA